MKENNSKIRAIYENDVVFVIRILTFVFGVIAAFFWIKYDIGIMQKDIDIIRTNELVHIQASINENKEDIKENKDTIQKINLNIEKILTILEANEGANH